MLNSIDGNLRFRILFEHLLIKSRQGEVLSNFESAIVKVFKHNINLKFEAILKRDLINIDDIQDELSALFIRPVGDFCNIACTYCYQNELRKNGNLLNLMPYEVIEKIFKHLAFNKSKGISIVWHGGEPLMAGKEFFREVILLINKYFSNRYKIRNSIQTNGLLLDEEWLQIFKQAGFIIGISIDGPQEIHDSQRIDKTGKGTFKKTAEKIKLIQKSGMDLNAICVINDSNYRYAKSIIETITNFEIKNCNIQPNFSSPTEYIDPRKYSDFVIEFWNEWKSCKQSLSVRFFENFISTLLGGKTDDCVFSGKCSNLLAISPNGDVTPCSRTFFNEFTKLGNIKNHTINEVFSSIENEKFRQQDLISQKKSELCKYHEHCNQGCPQHRINDNGRQMVDGKNVFCGCLNKSGYGYNTIFDEISNETISLFKKYDC